MKVILQMLLIALMVGCAAAPAPQIKQAAQKYQAVSRSMSRDDVYHLLGQPQNRLADGREQWRVSDRRQSAELLLRFSTDGDIIEIEKHYPMTSE